MIYIWDKYIRENALTLQLCTITVQQEKWQYDLLMNLKIYMLYSIFFGQTKMPYFYIVLLPQSKSTFLVLIRVMKVDQSFFLLSSNIETEWFCNYFSTLSLCLSLSLYIYAYDAYIYISVISVNQSVISTKKKERNYIYNILNTKCNLN